ncbi:hypothetical protein DFJ74DRAFT_705174 [Hyaloraphidium curvatum]|nr:hypothetical protein DFJ74DRAFT_705174 [Hyaloraphidium curvatum]
MAFSGLNLDDVAEFAPESFAYPAAARIDDGPASDKEDALADLADNEDEDLWQDDGQGSHMHVLSPLDMLASCFPDVDSRKLSTVLAGNNFSLSRTMDELFGVGAQSGKPKKAVDDRDLSWRATGANVERLYLEARKHAFQQAAIRNRYFQLAAELYRRGAGAAAAEMARRGRELNEVVQTLHGEAAEEILQQRNSGGSLMELDLHGLHPQEAVNALQSHLNMLADRRATGTLKIIIGSGNHSARGLQLAKPVEGFLATQGYRYSLGTMKDGRGGIILVTV